MPRRIATLLTSGLLLLGLLFAAALLKVPYGEMSPGPTVNTLGEHNGAPVLHIDGAQTYETSGHLNMTTVRVTGVNYRMNLVEAISGWVSDKAAVVPHGSLYPSDQSAEEVDQQNAEEFSRSQESAKAAALLELGYELDSETVVAAVVQDSPSQDRLRAGDVILAVDGEKVTESSQVAEVVTRHEPGEETVFTVSRATEDDGAEELDVTITTAAAEDDGRAIVGILAEQAYVFPFEIDIELADVGGPSAGLMFALGLIDKLSREDLTGGAFVAGTGTITSDGEVGPIGGVHMKTIAARDKGAEYFLTPADNCVAAAEDAPGGLTLAAVETLDDALAALEHIRAGTTGQLKTCQAG